MNNKYYRLVLAYDGTDYAGWQIQPGKRTVQGQLERVLAKLFETRIVTVGSGRTDAGVHALGQVAVAREVPWRVDAHTLKRVLNTKLPDDISILDCTEASPKFHPIRESTGKRYEYRLRSGGASDPFAQRFMWQTFYRLDVDAMREGAKHLLGRHDFKSFQAIGGRSRTTVREVRMLEIEEVQRKWDGVELRLGIEANGFLYNMVRNIVGTLVEVGRRKRPPEWIAEVLASCDRNRAGPTAPPNGLCLVRVDFPSPLPSEVAASDELIPLSQLPQSNLE